MFQRCLIALSVWVFFSSVGLADEASLKVGEAEIPDAVPSVFQEVLESEGYTVSLDGTAAATFWVRKPLPSADSGSSELGVEFGTLPQGGLVGIVELLTEWSDYKNNAIAPGVYTLRYGIMPADGNHMGVATYRDFLMLLPLEVDGESAEALDFAEVLSSSTQATGVPHPAVLALFPIWEEPEKPTLTKNDLDQWTLAIPMKSKVLGLVVQGHGEIEGY